MELTKRLAEVSPSNTPIGTETLPTLTPSFTPTKLTAMIWALIRPRPGTWSLLTFIAVVLEAWFSGYTVSAQNVRRAAIVGSLVVLVAVVATACALMVAGDRMPQRWHHWRP